MWTMDEFLHGANFIKELCSRRLFKTKCSVHSTIREALKNFYSLIKW